ncbi:hypothetical protein PG997_014525 [Apiospora hydei]|uniref:Secreted protein n=1 Tax=Apiospora hydei TaxID=1337664 RepID=A0ABR1UU29_9PEZI
MHVTPVWLALLQQLLLPKHDQHGFTAPALPQNTDVTLSPSSHRSFQSNVELQKKHTRKRDRPVPGTVKNYARISSPLASTARIVDTRPGWYRERLREELRERRLANGPCEKLSETADVMFAISRAQHDGFPVRQSLLAPKATFGRRGSCGVCAYMLAKYTSRWLFYQTAVTISGISRFRSVCEVVNPAKDKKIEEVASRHQLPLLP